MWTFLKNKLGWGRRGPGPRLVIHRDYQVGLVVPQYDARRPFRIISYLEKQGLLRRGMLHRPRPVSIRQLAHVHSPDYLRSLEAPGALESILGLTVSQELQDNFLVFQRTMCGGTLRAAHMALSHRDLAVNLGGGLHHAYPDRGSGFCVFNDIALAVNTMRRHGFEDNVLVVDLDLHDGDGTRAFFADDPTVHTFSIHNEDLDPRAAVADTSIALGPDVPDDTYLRCLRGTLPEVVTAVKPGLVFFIAGADPCIDDSLGNWRITGEGMRARDEFVLSLIDGLPTVILLGGGYGKRAWRHGAALASWLISGSSDLDIPVEMELPVGQFRRLARMMKTPDLLPDPVDLAGPLLDEDWGLMEDDLGLGAPQAERRFLGLFTPFGVELALEEAGLLGRLRQMGYAKLKVLLDLTDPMGHTLRVLSGDEDPKTVFETRLRLDMALEPGQTLLAVEWLLIQDAGARFRMDRPLLPGQSHPGLGLLRDTAAALVVLCEKLNLDGLTFTPSHYHLAALSRPLAMSPDPEREGTFDAMVEAVRGLRLAEAARIVEGGRLNDMVNDRALRWEPTRLVIPVSERRKRRFQSTEYAAARHQARQACRFEIK